MVGGVTYEEAKEIEVMHDKQQASILLGGSYIHNSKSFLADITQLVL